MRTDSGSPLPPPFSKTAIGCLLAAYLLSLVAVLVLGICAGRVG